MRILFRVYLATVFILACTSHSRAFQNVKLRSSAAALVDELHSSRNQPTRDGGIHMVQQQIQNPRHIGAIPSEDDLKPGGRSGPPDETSVFLNMLPVVIPCIFLIAILIVVIALRYFNAIAEQTPEASYFDANVKGVPRREDVGSFARTGKHF